MDKLEPSKQYQRPVVHPQPKRPKKRKSERPKRRKSSVGAKSLKKRRLVNYSSSDSSDSDSFLSSIDRISLSPTPSPQKLDPLTPIPHKWKMNRRFILSPTTPAAPTGRKIKKEAEVEVSRPSTSKAAVKKSKSQISRKKSAATKRSDKGAAAKKATTKQKNARPARKARSDTPISEDEDPTLSDEEEEAPSNSRAKSKPKPKSRTAKVKKEKVEKMAAPPTAPLPPEKKKNKRWTVEENKKLKVALKVILWGLHG